MQWYDQGCPVREDDTVESIQAHEVERLSMLLAVAVTAQEHPRRLGTDATPDELALDKTRAKRIAHSAAQCLKSWGGHPNGTAVDAARLAAQVNWRNWWNEQQVYLVNRRRYIATWAIKTGADPRWCKSAVVKINNELQWLAYALRD